jgi:SAM-dependent methyltransferase
MRPIAEASPENPTSDALRILKFVPQAARRVLDFGCGDGARARALKARGVPHVVGIETEAVGGRCTGPDTLLLGPLESTEPPPERAAFDCILSDGAFARLRDPARVLARFRTLLAPGGLLLLSAPNVQHHETFSNLVGGRWPAPPEGSLAFEQIRFYTGYELHRLIAARGFVGIKLMALTTDPESAFPRHADGMIRHDRMSLGPLNDQEYVAFLIREYLLLGQVPGSAPA